MTPTESTPRMGGREWVLLLILSAVWGSSFFFKVLAAGLPPLTVVLGRVGLAAVALNLFLALRGERMPRGPRLWGAFLVMGLLNNVVPFTLIVFGETRISSGLASILNATTPIFTVLAADRLTTTERLTRAKGIGVLCGFAGVAVLIGPAALRGLGGGDVVGEAACLLAALSYAFAGIFGRCFAGIPGSPVHMVLLRAVIGRESWRHCGFAAAHGGPARAFASGGFCSRSTLGAMDPASI